MFCKNCGRQLPDESAFCKFCGTPQHAVPAQQPAAPDVEPELEPDAEPELESDFEPELESDFEPEFESDFESDVEDDAVQDTACADFEQYPPEPSYMQDQPAVQGGPSKKKVLVIVGIVAVAVALLMWFLLSLTDPVANLKDSIWDGYDSSRTIGEAFEENFTDTSWTHYEIDGFDYIRFCGTIESEYGDSYVEINFSVTEFDDYYHFQVVDALMDGTYLSDAEISALMQYGFDGDLEQMVSSMMLYWIFG